MDPVLIVFAIAAGVIIYRLYTVLGQKTGHERPRGEMNDRLGRDQKAAQGSSEYAREDDNVISLADRETDGQASAPRFEGPPGLNDIHGVDSTFHPNEFLQGAKAAYEMVISAFAAGDARSLKALVSGDVYNAFAEVIEARRKRGDNADTQLIGIDNAQIVDAVLDGRMARVIVDFASQQVRYVKNASGETIEGDPSRIDRVRDRWTFERDVRSSDPNWTLVATGLAA